MLEEMNNKEEMRDTRLHSVPLTEGTPRSNNSSNEEKNNSKSIFYNIISYICCCLKKN